MAAGIYKITNVKTGQMYIGQSVTIKTRWRQHKNALTKGIHYNPFLQNSWNKHGEENFVFELIEKINRNDKDKLNEREKYWIKYYNTFESDFHYNLTPGGDAKEYSFEERLFYAKGMNTSGIFGVWKSKIYNEEELFAWIYNFKTKNGEYISFSDRDLNHLKKRVILANLPWLILDEEQANQSFEDNEEILSKYPKKENISGFYHVSKVSRDQFFQSFYWAYWYFDDENNRRAISRINLEDLKTEVKKKNLPWKIINETIAKKSIEDNKINMGNYNKNKNKTGVIHLNKTKNPIYKQGFTWNYQIKNNHDPHSLNSIDLLDLKEKVIKKGLPWEVIDNESYEKCLKENEENLSKYPKTINTTGIEGVKKRDDKYSKTWTYNKQINGKHHQLSSINLLNLKEKVLDKGLPWVIIDEENHNKSIKENQEMNKNKYKNKNKNKKRTHTTGIKGVSKKKEKDQRINWIYRKTINGKLTAIGSVNLLELKRKVLEKNLPWEVIDEDKYNESLKENKQALLKSPKRENIAGVLGVYKKRFKNRYRWVYRRKIDETLNEYTSNDLTKLKEKVLDKGLPWEIIDDSKYNDSLKENETMNKKT